MESHCCIFMVTMNTCLSLTSVSTLTTIEHGRYCCLCMAVVHTVTRLTHIVCIFYSCLILQFMYFYWKRLCILIVVYVFLLLSMYSYCCLCILIVVNVFLLLSMYSYCCLCILIVVYVFLLLSMYSYRCLCVVYVFLDVATLTAVFPCFFLSCKANASV